jgi:succinate dehydrogenase flavin-adding protein (antitoxin of CptAB toxin-antitoxin module)
MTTRIETINNNTAALKKSEKVSKALLIALSRDILFYLYLDEVNDTVGSGDVTPINRVLRVLSPMNKQMAIHFFKHFAAWRYDNDLGEFTTKNKKQYDKKLELVKEFLDDEDNNIFSWAADNIKVEAKEVDYLAKLRKDFKKAFENGITMQQVLDLLAEVDAEEQPQAEAA